MSSSTTPITLRVIAGGGISNVLQELGPQFERASGHALAITYDGTPALVRRFKADEAFDVTVIPRQAFDDPAATARIAPAPIVDIARVGVGLGVRAGAPKPDIATAEALKATLLRAKSITMVPESANGAHILRVFERLGIADAMQAKMLAQGDPLALAPALARGEAEIGLYVTNLLLAPGIALVGEFPAELNTHLTFTAGLSRNAAHPEAAKAFIAFLSTAAAAETIKAKGMEPLV
ncbi:MAG: substrate-binding domain-containing protein [Variibacter sp.]|nr:substrate-binding domain-containing protein [Variibacter sp.]